jgi:uncharacterized membrane protein
VGTAVIAIFSLATSTVTPNRAIETVIGLVLVFLAPGFSLACSVLSDGQLTRAERLLASIGLSLAITVCVAVALAALPVGLTRHTMALALGGLCLLLALLGIARIKLADQANHESAEDMAIESE